MPSPEQLKVLKHWLVRNPDFVTGEYMDCYTTEESREVWLNIANRLNLLRGPKKHFKQWKRFVSSMVESRRTELIHLKKNRKLRRSTLCPFDFVLLKRMCKKHEVDTHEARQSTESDSHVKIKIEYDMDENKYEDEDDTNWTGFEVNIENEWTNTGHVEAPSPLVQLVMPRKNVEVDTSPNIPPASAATWGQKRSKEIELSDSEDDLSEGERVSWCAPTLESRSGGGGSGTEPAAELKQRKIRERIQWEATSVLERRLQAREREIEIESAEVAAWDRMARMCERLVGMAEKHFHQKYN